LPACRPTLPANVRSLCPANDGQAPPTAAARSQPPKRPPPIATAVRRSAPTLFIDRPLRSGQQVYARGGDLVVLAAVNAGAEVIADGHIHIYAPLHGRALAGASGAAEARIFCTRFDAELVSVAGLYRTFDSGVPPSWPANRYRSGSLKNPRCEAGKLIVEPLQTD
jgi:septum site-determining protein MinC